MTLGIWQKKVRWFALAGALCCMLACGHRKNTPPVGTGVVDDQTYAALMADLSSFIYLRDPWFVFRFLFSISSTVFCRRRWEGEKPGKVSATDPDGSHKGVPATHPHSSFKCVPAKHT